METSMGSARGIKPANAVNRMTAQWIRTCGEESAVFCAPSAWPLLALLADAAEGPGRAELADAVGLPAADSRAAALEILRLLGGMTAVRSALGVWTNEHLALDPAWTEGLPLGVAGLLTGDPAVDTPLLDGWAEQNTDGLIDRMPVKTDKDTLLLLAAAMSVRTRWLRPFEDLGWTLTYDSGPWSGRPYHPLRRVTKILDRVTVATTDQGQITCLELLGTDGITVHLVIGEQERPAREVLKGGLVARTGRGRRGGELRIGDTAPGLTVEWSTGWEPDDHLVALAPRFRVDAEHDLLKHPEVFGLETVTDKSHGHFPAMSHHPLAVSAAKQNAIAHFTAEGFEAAAVTALGIAVGGAPTRKLKQVRVEFDRPFGFFASHRTSGLILAAGWVAEPEAAEPADEGFDFKF
jgi:serine protease inhibitor